MGWDFCDSKNVKTRKEHNCAFCGRTILAGSEVFYWGGMYNGEFQSSYACNWCDDHQESLLNLDNEITDDFSTCLREDIFYSEVKNLGHLYVDADVDDSDWFIFTDYETDEEVHREYCPIVSATKSYGSGKGE